MSKSSKAMFWRSILGSWQKGRNFLYTEICLITLLHLFCIACSSTPTEFPQFTLWFNSKWRYGSLRLRVVATTGTFLLCHSGSAVRTLCCESLRARFVLLRKSHRH